ncbi:MAG: phosphopantetheine-binding protein, partial [Bacteroidota bacterium]
LGQIVEYLAQKGGASAATKATANETTSPPSPVATDASVANNTGMDTAGLEKILLTVVSEKTGYPTEMLELNMDMEADLGIDSIKRVEIFGAMTEQYPEVSGINPQELTELRTLGQIVDYLAEKKKVVA